MNPAPTISMHIGGVNAAQMAFDQAEAELKSLQSAMTAFNRTAAEQSQSLNAVQRAFEEANKQAEGFSGTMRGLQGHMDGFKVEGMIGGLRQIRDASEIAHTSVAGLMSEIDRLNHMHMTVPSSGGGGGGGSGSGGSSDGSHRGGVAGELGRSIVQGTGYMLAYDAMNYAGQGFSNDLAYQRQTAVNAATTDIGALSPAQRQAIDTYVTGLAGGGAQPYGRLTLAQGLAPIEGATTDLGAIRAVNKAGYMGSAIDGSTDTLTMNQTLTQILGSYGIRDPKAMGAQAMGYEDVIQNMINKGLVQPSQVAGSIPTFSGYAASVGMSFQNAGGVFGALTNYTKDPQMAAQQERALIADVTSGPMHNKHQRDAIAAAGLGDYFGSDAMKMDPTKWLTGVESHIAKDPGKYLPLLFPNQDALAGMQNLIGQGGANMGTSTGIFAAMGRTGTTAAGFEQYQQNPAAKFDDSMAQFKTASEKFADAALPLATALVGFTTDGVKALNDVLAGPGGKGGLMGSFTGAMSTLTHFISPTDPGFGNIDVARRESGNDITHPSAGNGPGQGAGHYITGPAGRQIWVPASTSTLTDPANTESAGRAAIDTRIIPSHGGYLDTQTFRLYQTRQAADDATYRGGGSAPTSTGERVSGLDSASTDADAYQDQFNPGRHLYAMQAEQARRNAPTGPHGTPTDYGTLDLLAAGGKAPKGRQGEGLYFAAEGPSGGATTAGEAVGAADAKWLASQRADLVGKDQNAVEAARLQYEAAQLQHKAPDAIRTAFLAYIDDQKALAKDQGMHGTQLANFTRGLDNQVTGFDYSAKAQGLTYQQQQLQDKVTLAGLQHNPASLAAAQATLRGFDTANAGILNLTPTQLQIQGLQDSQGAAGTKLGFDQSHLALLQSQGDTAGAKKLIDQVLADEKATGVNPYQLALDKQNMLGALPKTPAPQLIRPATDGPGDLTAGYGQVDARQALPERPRAGEQQQIALLEQQLDYWKKKDSRDTAQIEILARSLHEQQAQTRGIGTLVVAGEARARAAGTTTHAGPPLRPHR